MRVTRALLLLSLSSPLLRRVCITLLWRSALIAAGKELRGGTGGPRERKSGAEWKREERRKRRKRERVIGKPGRCGYCAHRRGRRGKRGNESHQRAPAFPRNHGRHTCHGLFTLTIPSQLCLPAARYVTGPIDRCAIATVLSLSPPNPKRAHP